MYSWAFVAPSSHLRVVTTGPPTPRTFRARVSRVRFTRANTRRGRRPEDASGPHGRAENRGRFMGFMGRPLFLLSGHPAGFLMAKPSPVHLRPRDLVREMQLVDPTSGPSSDRDSHVGSTVPHVGTSVHPMLGEKFKKKYIYIYMCL